MATTLKYMQHGAPLKREYRSLHDAMADAFYRMDHGEIFPKEIASEGITYTEDDIQKYWDEHNIAEKSL